MTVLDVLRDPDLSLDAPEQIRRPVMVQTWTNLSFIHWPFDPEIIQSLLPPSLEVDSFDSWAWIGVIPFRLGVRLPPWIPAVPGISETPEVNVRTYVRGPDGRRGIWFLSLDASALAAVALARAWYRLPYRRARSHFWRNGNLVRYESQRRMRRIGLVRFAAESVLAPDHVELSSRDRFLTCRWRLYSPGRRGLMVTVVEHPPWHVFPMTMRITECGLLAPLGLHRPAEAPLVLFSPGVTARFGRRRLAN